jgi:hypothetical protein
LEAGAERRLRAFQLPEDAGRCLVIAARRRHAADFDDAVIDALNISA